jgi:hypothetical protein
LLVPGTDTYHPSQTPHHQSTKQIKRTMTSEKDESSNSKAAAADEARAKAEARRKRILEKSRDRMGIVSGEQLRVPTTAAEDAAANAAAAVDMSTTVSVSDADADGDADEIHIESTNKESQEDTDVNASKSQPSGSARMNAMRRRRFAKKKEEEEEDKDADQTQRPDVAVLSEQPSPPIEDVTIANDGTDDHEAPVATPVLDKKKYKGVAATRRQMLKDKAAAQEQSTKDELQTAKPVLAIKKKIPTLPIYMHLFTILLFFTAGLILGTHHVVHERVTVHRHILAPQEHGAGILRLYKNRNNKHKARLQKKLEWDTGRGDDNSMGAGDEFASDNDDDAAYVPNIDPLFQLDLDKFTEGDSLFMMGARMAVAMHRLNLYFFYYLPLAIFNSLTRFPLKLVQTPPLLCMFALALRQFAKRVLGATLPDNPNSAKNHASASGSKDILAMIKQGVMTFLSSSFPTLVEVFDAFAHLRSDMFIILCGMFVGLAYNHHYFDATSSSLSDHDEL